MRHMGCAVIHSSLFKVVTDNIELKASLILIYPVYCLCDLWLLLLLLDCCVAVLTLSRRSTSPITTAEGLTQALTVT